MSVMMVGDVSAGFTFCRINEACKRSAFNKPVINDGNKSADSDLTAVPLDSETSAFRIPVRKEAVLSGIDLKSVRVR